MEALVSVIIPVYNIENYIENCLNSVVNQTYKNLEIICVDDGSNDKSAEKIKAIAEKDSRVKYFYQKNAGVSAARNLGLQKVTGEYVMFVDGDDYLHFQAVELLLNEIEKYGCDMVCAEHRYTQKLDEKQSAVSKAESKAIGIPEMFVSRGNSCLGKSSCGKLIKTSAAQKAHFPVGITNGEDGYYVIMLLDSGITVRHIEAELYYYYSRPDSAVTAEFNLRQFSITYSFDMLCDELANSKNAFLKKYCLQYLFQTILYNRTRAIGTACEKQVLQESKKIGRKRLGEFMKNKDISPVIRLSFAVFFCSRHIYELVRAIQDPTMLDFYKNRRKGNTHNEA